MLALIYPLVPNKNIANRNNRKQNRAQRLSAGLRILVYNRTSPAEQRCLRRGKDALKDRVDVAQVRVDIEQGFEFGRWKDSAYLGVGFQELQE